MDVTKVAQFAELLASATHTQVNEIPKFETPS